MSLLSKLFSRAGTSRPPVSPAERRHGVRYRDGQQTWLFSAQGTAGEAEIVDSNGQGLRLLTRAPLQPHQRHTLLVTFRGVQVRFLIESLWSRRAADGRTEAGARIIPLSAADQSHQVSYRHHLIRTRTPLSA
ncbi:MAG: hypothetical protein ACYCW6_32445 [Candidatus Xenobia bacterium]